MTTPRQFGRGNVWGAAKEAAVGGGLTRQATVLLTNSQILGLTTTSQTIIAAPGANKMIVVDSITLLAHWVTVYGGDATFDALYFKYSEVDRAIITSLFNGDMVDEGILHIFLANVNVGVGDFTTVTNLLVPASVWAPNWYENYPANPAANAADRINKPVYAKLSIAGTLTGGNASNTLRISALYHILDVTTGQYE